MKFSSKFSRLWTSAALTSRSYHDSSVDCSRTAHATWLRSHSQFNRRLSIVAMTESNCLGVRVIALVVCLSTWRLALLPAGAVAGCHFRYGPVQLATRASNRPWPALAYVPVLTACSPSERNCSLDCSMGVVATDWSFSDVWIRTAWYRPPNSPTDWRIWGGA